MINTNHAGSSVIAPHIIIKNCRDLRDVTVATSLLCASGKIHDTKMIAKHIFYIIISLLLARRRRSVSSQQPLLSKHCRLVTLEMSTSTETVSRKRIHRRHMNLSCARYRLSANFRCRLLITEKVDLPAVFTIFNLAVVPVTTLFDAQLDPKRSFSHAKRPQNSIDLATGVPAIHTGV